MLNFITRCFPAATCSVGSLTGNIRQVGVRLASIHCYTHSSSSYEEIRGHRRNMARSNWKVLTFHAHADNVLATRLAVWTCVKNRHAPLSVHLLKSPDSCGGSISSCTKAFWNSTLLLDSSARREPHILLSQHLLNDSSNTGKSPSA